MNLLTLMTVTEMKMTYIDSFMLNFRWKLLTTSITIHFLIDMKDVPFPDDTLTLLSFNIRSFSANFQGLLDQCLNERMCMYFDIMAFQETRLDNHIISLFQLPEFNNCYTQCRNTVGGGGGVALYVSKVYSSSLLPDLCYMETDIECVIVELK